MRTYYNIRSTSQRELYIEDSTIPQLVSLGEVFEGVIVLYSLSFLTWSRSQCKKFIIMTMQFICQHLRFLLLH